ncbi:MAG: efflux RND transporter permease subunit [Balneolaceae bacterium]|nr:efflux RND transporter permease subunit [Balneolaceae bacterium]
MQGIAGQLFSDQALTVTFSLLASLVVAITLIPMLSSLGDRKKEEVPAPELKEPRTKVGRSLRAARLFVFVTIPKFLVRMGAKAIRGISRGVMFLITPLLNGFESGYMAIENRYPTIIRWALDKKFVVVTLAFGLLIASLSLVPHLGMELIPSLSQGEFNVEFKMPPGTPIENTDAALKSVQSAATSLSRVNTTFAVAGSGNQMDANPEEGGENWGELNVVLADGSDRSVEEQTIAELRSDLQRIPGLMYKFSRPALFTFKTPIEIEISGYDLDNLKK